MYVFYTYLTEISESSTKADNLDRMVNVYNSAGNVYGHQRMGRYTLFKIRSLHFSFNKEIGKNERSILIFPR